MDLVELLMTEHAALRVYFRQIRELNSPLVFEIDDFVANCHAKIEDELVFPALRAIETSPSNRLAAFTKRMEEEHRLLEALGNDMRVAVGAKGEELDKNKVALYVDTLEAHNAGEETLLFRHWKEVSEGQARSATGDAKSTIREFGWARYLRTTGLSQELLDRVE